MKKVSISILKNSLSHYLNYVKRGTALVITDRDRPVAEILPFTQRRTDSKHRLEFLESEGLVKCGDKSRLKSLTHHKSKVKSGVLAELLEERKDTR